MVYWSGYSETHPDFTFYIKQSLNRTESLQQGAESRTLLSHISAVTTRLQCHAPLFGHLNAEFFNSLVLLQQKG